LIISFTCSKSLRRRLSEQRGAAGLRAVAPAIDVLATSPLVRAVQTAEILAAVYNGRNMVTVRELSPIANFPRSSNILFPNRSLTLISVPDSEVFIRCGPRAIASL